MPLLTGAVVLIMLGASAASRCVGARSGVHPSVVAPLVVIGVALALVPVGLSLGGQAAVVARWVWLIGAVLAIPASQLVHAAMVGIQSMAELGEVKLRRIATYSTPSIDAIDRLEVSIDSELDRLVAHSPGMADRR